MNVSFPTRVMPEDYGSGDLANVEAITDEEFVSFFVRFADVDIPSSPVQRTFL